MEKMNNKNKYKEEDLDLGIEFEYVHPRLNREVKSGSVTSVALR